MGIAKAALVIMIGNVLSRLLGLVREQVIAGLFGAGSQVDAFTAASRLPTSVYDLLIGGMISAALVPVFSDYARDEKESEFWQLASVVLNVAAVVLSAAMLLLAVFAPQMMSVFAAGYDDEVRQLSVDLVRYMLPAVFFMGMSGILTAFLYSRQSFVIPALCVALFNASIVVAALLFHESLSVNSLILGWVIGAFLQAVVQIAGLRRMKLTLRFDLGHPGLRRILRLYLPVALGLVVSTVVVAIDTRLASFTGEGNLAAMRYATYLTQFPIGLVASALSFAVLPSLSRLSPPQTTSLQPKTEAAASEDLTAYKSTLAFGLKLTLLAILPATAGLVVLRQPLIQMIFEYGKFTASDTGRTALAFLAYSPGLPAAALDQLLIVAFYARKNTITPVLVGVMGAGVYLAVALALIGPLGMSGLALANSAQWIAHALVMLVLLWRAVGGLGGLGLGITALKTTAASAIMGIICYSLLPALRLLIDTNSIAGLAALLTILSGLGAASYVSLLLLFGTQELGTAWGILRLRLASGRKS